MLCKEGRQSKISLKQNDVVSFDSKKNVNSILENPYFKIYEEYEEFVLHNVQVKSVEKILKT